MTYSIRYKTAFTFIQHKYANSLTNIVERGYNILTSKNIFDTSKSSK